MFRRPSAILAAVTLAISTTTAQGPVPALTPGQVLLLANAPGPASAEALMHALASDDPHVRLVAGRVMAVEPEVASVDALVDALSREQDRETGAELVMDLLLVGGQTTVPVVDPQARRLGPEALLAFAEWQARMQPEQLASRLADLAAALTLDAPSLAPIVALAERQHKTADHGDLIERDGAKHIPFVDTAIRMGRLTAPERKAASLVLPSRFTFDEYQGRQASARTIPAILSGAIADVFRGAGCDATVPKFAGVEVTYAPAGNPRRLQVDTAGSSSNCTAALTALARTTLAGVQDAVTPTFTQWLLLPINDGFAACPGTPESIPKIRPADDSQKIQQPRKIKDVKPVYPPSAQAQRIQGVVILDARISTTGCVNSARVVRSIPGLDFAAVAAVTQWQFSPTLFGGQPVPVLMTVTVNFELR